MALAAGLAATPAMAQNQPRTLNNEADARAVAMTPLTDLNLTNDPIPELLLAARNAPYDNAGLRNCRDVLRLVGELDTVLGTDYDMEVPEDRTVSAGNIAQRILGSFIPFRGIIREVSGANEHERDFREAIAAGMMRRAYLKGRGQGMGCDYPARPATAAQAAAWRAERDAREQQAETDEDNDDNRRDRERDAARAANSTNDGGTEFISEPVVQDIN
jgi:hypothetical protein